MKDRDLHVALISPWQTGGGLANYSKRLQEALDAVGIRVTVVPITHAETWNPVRFNNIIERIPPDTDVVHVQYEAGVFGRLGVSGICTPSFYARLTQIDTTVVTTIHEVHRLSAERSPIKRAIIGARDWVVERTILTASDTTIIHTANAEDILRERHGDQWSLERMRHPVDEPIAAPMSQDAAREAFDIDSEIVLLTFGWVESKKQYTDVIHCLKHLPEATYLIAGEPRHESDKTVLEEVFALASQLGVRDRVQHLGYVAEEDLPTLFGATDVAIAPYEQVTQSGAINTALAYHCPVIASALPAFEELAADYECVLIYHDHETLLNLLRDATTRNTQEQLCKAAKQYAKEETWSSFAEDTAALYDTNGSTTENK
jgi:glycosyltransferase involved in cell wall biosynthesis